MEYYFECYGDLSLQRTMVADAVRTDAFAAAIAEVVKPGHRVLDVGTGTGLLAMLAARAGAEWVCGVDQASVAETALALVAHNGLTERVEIREGNAAQLRLDAPVDVLVSEWLGHFAFAETMLDDVLSARDLNLKPGGTMLPASVDLILAPISAPNLYHNYGPGFWQKPVHGIDFSPLEAEELLQAFGRKSDLPPSCLLTEGKVLFTLDLATTDREGPWQSGECCFTIEEDGVLDGFAGWFAAQLSPSVRLETGPRQPYTHWEHQHFMIRPRAVTAGQELRVSFELRRHPYMARSVELTLRMGRERWRFTVD